ncbi:MAG: hypothetical protein LBR43_00480 [Spiroplasmataceae bacterium]|nr:hypothetical protein [Spiroplasmataceae bacterium]
MVTFQKDLEVSCFKCNKQVIVKYNYPKKKYSDKNNWYYWTEREENKDKYICNLCLKKLYYKNKKEYLLNVTNKKKRLLMNGYFSNRSFDNR